MTLKRLALIAGLLTAIAAPAHAARVVLDFEDHPGNDVLLADGYGGVNWGGAFRTYDEANSGNFYAHSGKTAAYFNYTDGGMTPGRYYTQSLIFDQPVIFEGAWFSGDANFGAAFEFYLNGVYLGQTATNVTSNPVFLAGLGKAVNEVRVRGGAGNFIIDDLTYNTDLGVAAVPEPATWAMMIFGFGLTGALLRRSRERPAPTFS